MFQKVYQHTVFYCNTWCVINLIQYAPKLFISCCDSFNLCPICIKFSIPLPYILVQRGAGRDDIRSKATDLQKDLGDVEHRWYQLGVLLGLPVHTLDGFQENYDDLRDRLRVMLQEWLQKGYTGEYEVPSWQVLVDAVEHSAGGENPRLAGELAKKRGS